MMVMYGGTRRRERRDRDACSPPHGTSLYPGPVPAPARRLGARKRARLKTIRRHRARACRPAGGLRLRRPLPAWSSDRCRAALPPPMDVGAGHVVRCIRTDVSMASASRRMTAYRRRRRAASRREGSRAALHAAARSLFRPPAQVRALNGVTVRVDAGESLRHGRRVGLGQVDLRAARRWRWSRRASGRSRSLGRRPATGCRPTSCARLRRDFQMVFQDPYGSLDPRHDRRAHRRASPLTALGRRRSRHARERVAEVLRRSAWRADMDKYPHEFSGGQRQRIAIARALITRPEADRRRRAGLGARRLRAGAGAQPAAWTCRSSSG